MLNESYNIMRENDKLLEDLEEENEIVEPLMDTIVLNKKKAIIGSTRSSRGVSGSNRLSSTRHTK